MARYRQPVEATSNGTGGNFDSFIEITAASATTVILKRLRISTKTAGKDDVVTVKIVRKSVAGTGSTSGTPIPTRTGAPTATATTKIKNGTTNFTEGTIASTLDQFSFNGRIVMDIPVEYESAVAGILGIDIARSDNSVVTDVEAEWEE
jgi:hypothetical protein